MGDQNFLSVPTQGFSNIHGDSIKKYFKYKTMSSSPRRFDCSVCLEEDVKSIIQPRILWTCDHSVCETCGHMMRGLLCPLCRSPPQAGIEPRRQIYEVDSALFFADDMGSSNNRIGSDSLHTISNNARRRRLRIMRELITETHQNRNRSAVTLCHLLMDIAKDKKFDLSRRLDGNSPFPWSLQIPTQEDNTIGPYVILKNTREPFIECRVVVDTGSKRYPAKLGLFTVHAFFIPCVPSLDEEDGEVRGDVFFDVSLARPSTFVIKSPRLYKIGRSIGSVDQTKRMMYLLRKLLWFGEDMLVFDMPE